MAASDNATPVDSRAVSPAPSIDGGSSAFGGAANAGSAAAAALLAEKLSNASAPRPWKNAAFAARPGPAIKRSKNAKQVLALERDRQLGPAFKKSSQLGAAGRKKRKEALAAAAAAEAAADGMDVDDDSRTPTNGLATPAGTAAASTSVPPVTWPLLTPPDFSIEAPPSVRPAKHYCDVTGLEAPYRDPKSQLRYHNAEVYSLVRTFGPSAHQAYLSVRGSAAVLM